MGILILASFLFLLNLGKEGYSNSYYAAAVKSMLINPGIILYNSFDPVGFVTIDKPPVSLWIQTMSAAVFGYSGFALILPQVIAGLCSIFLLYYLVGRSWGKNAGLIAALALTITPIFVAVVRTNNMDGLLVFILLFAICLAIKAWRCGSLWYLIGSAILIGIGFNVKMIQAFVVIPSCFGIYLLNMQISWRKKISDIVIAFVVLVVLSASWAVFMDLTPADQRPYIGSSQQNSVLDLVLGYNGLNRILGGYGPSDMKNGRGNGSISGAFPGGSGTSLPPGTDDGFPGNPPPGFPPGGESGFSERLPPVGGNYTHGFPPGMGNGGHPGGGPGMNDGGEPGLFRMGDAGMSGQISWMLPFALIGLLTWLFRPSRKILMNLNERAVLTLSLLLWLVPELIYFSFTTGFYHTYYVVMVAIPLAGLVGIGCISMCEAYIRNDSRGWSLVLAIIVTGIVQWQFMRYNAEFSGILSWIILIGSIFAGLILSVLRIYQNPVTSKIRETIIFLGISLLFIAPFIWACTPVFYQLNAGIPAAGPALISGGGNFPGMNRGIEGGNTSALYSYLSSHQSGEIYLVGVESSGSASDLIINYGAPVMAMGGFSGSDNILTLDAVKDLIGSEKIRYFLLGQKSPGMPQRQDSSVTSWISDSCPVVFEDEWNTENRSIRVNSALYDCKGVV